MFIIPAYVYEDISHASALSYALTSKQTACVTCNRTINAQRCAKE